MAALGQHIQLRHQLGADDREHLLHLVAVLSREALARTLDDRVKVRIADVVVIDVFLGGAQEVFAAVGGGLDLFHIALFDKAADFISRVGVEMPIIRENSAMVGSPIAMMPSMQKDSTVVSVASRVAKR